MENLTQEQKQFIQNLQGKQRDSYNRARSAGIPPIEALEIVVKSMPTDEVKKDGLVKRIVKEPLESFTRTALRTGQAIGGVISQATINAMPDSDPRKAEFQARLDKQLTSPTEVPIYSDAFGKIEPQKAFGQGGGMQIAGEALELASYIPITRVAGGVLQATKGGAVSNIMRTLGRESAFGAGAFTAGEQLQKGEINPSEIAKNIVLGYGLGAGLGIGGVLAGRGIQYLRKGATTTAGKSLKEVVKTTEKPSTTVAREVAEETAPKLSVSEKAVGLTQDVKRRISGKTQKMQEYIDIAKTRNVDDLAPTPYEYGSQQVGKAVTEMENVLNTTGSKIGQTRTKLGTYKADTTQLARIENVLNQQADKLNLKIDKGVISQKAGTVAKVGSGDIKALQEIYDNLLTVKSSPTLKNLIDFRGSVDSRINFGKMAREVSGEIDPLARQVRKQIADVGAELVGKTEAQNLARYSEFMDAYNELLSYTNRQAGGEYLLRLILSGRGGEARNLVNTIKEFTNIDLMDDATMMKLVTDYLGNEGQKNLFRQEITKAGLDANRILRGDVTGILGSAVEKAGDILFDPEKVLLEATR